MCITLFINMTLNILTTRTQFLFCINFLKSISFWDPIIIPHKYTFVFYNCIVLLKTNIVFNIMCVYGFCKLLLETRCLEKYLYITIIWCTWFFLHVNRLVPKLKYKIKIRVNHLNIQFFYWTMERFTIFIFIINLSV